MFPGTVAAATPERIAAVRPSTGDTITYGDLNSRSIQLARWFADCGLVRGDHVAVVSSNDLRMFEVYWAALRSGLYITAVNWHLTAAEAAYVIDDCGARALVASADAATAIPEDLSSIPAVEYRLVYGGTLAGFDDYDDALATYSTEPFASQPRGVDMLYSSGTTGRPKGVQPTLPDGDITETTDTYTAVFAPMYGFDADTVYLCPAPLYHAAPLRFTGMVMSMGGTVVLMDSFDAEGALNLIEKYRVTHSQWVPTMFVRLLKLPEEVRARADHSSLRVVIHAAAPCPPTVKRAMIEWWGPVVYEYYSSTEGAGITFIDSAQSLERPGSVGRDGALGTVHICDADGAELPTGEIGRVFWERDTLPFTYHNSPEKTAAAQHPEHPTWTTGGDIGYLDQDRYLYLTDRADFMIISGGVNIYPQEAENVLTLHPDVFDVAVIGVPDEEMGEQVKAVVQLEDSVAPTAETADRLLTYVREQVAHFKAPRTIDFVDELPRTPTGKLIKHRVRARYS